MNNAVKNLFTFEKSYICGPGYCQYDNVILLKDMGTKFKAGTKLPTAYFISHRLYLIEDVNDRGLPRDSDHCFNLVFDLA